MRQLLLLRHAKSDPPATDQPDHARPLSPSGRHAAAALRLTLRTLGLVPDVVLVSSARRTLQTLEALAPWDETPLVEPMDTLYLATAPQLLRIVAGVSGTVRSLLVVGHNPGLHDLAITLATAEPIASRTKNHAALTDGFPTSALAEFTLPGAWAELGVPHGQSGIRPLPLHPAAQPHAGPKLNALPPETSLPDPDLSQAPHPAEAALEFCLPDAEIPRLLRVPALIAARAGPIRTSAFHTVWHDTPDGALADAGLALSQTGAAPTRLTLWRLERLTPARAPDWPPATPAPILAEAATPDQLGHTLPSPLAPAAAFAGRQRTLPLTLPDGPAQLLILTGTLRGIAHDQPTCRIRLSGPTANVTALAHRLAETLPIVPPPASLAAAALALARARPTPPRHLGAPTLPRGLSIDAALAAITAHLADTILHWSTQIPAATGPDPVHQMRVGVRRLRSALTTFRRAATADDHPPAWLDTFADTLRALATRLGAARDWDVFLTETGADLQAALPHDRRVANLLAAAARRRTAAYTDLNAFLASQDWTRLAVTLAVLPTERPWNTPTPLTEPVQDYAGRALDRRLKQVLQPGSDLSGLTAPELHTVRKHAKRLRYAIEFFAPLFPDKAVRKYLPTLAHLQDVLGAVNDADAASHLMSHLASHAYATGVVAGFTAARAARALTKTHRAWSRLTRGDPFWE